MSASSSSSTSVLDTVRPFVQLVSFSAQDASRRSRLLEVWKPGCEYVNKEEAGKLTSTYELYQPITPQLPDGSVHTQPESSQEIMAMESYTSRIEFNQIHMTNPIILNFLDTIEKEKLLARPTKLTFLKASGYGFFSRGAATESRIRAKGSDAAPFTLVVDIQVRLPEQLDKLIQVWKLIADDVRQHEPDCLTYEAFTDLEDATHLIIFERYTHADALFIKHEQGSAFKHLGANIAAAGIEITKRQRRFYSELQLGIWGDK